MLRLTAALLAVIAVPSIAVADDVDIASYGAGQIWLGTTAGAAAGHQLARGRIGNNDTLADLVIGSPGSGSTPGRVYVFLGVPQRTGTASLSTANIVFTGNAGDRFGAALASGDVLNAVGAVDLVVGAPSASSGRGAVYLFAGPPSGGAIGAAAATFRIIGAPGDQLGTSVATADLNGDGYREIIAGAPGSQRVYVVNGSPSLSGTLDLSVSPAAAILTAPLVGSQVAAGDLDGDGVFDLTISASSSVGGAGRIYVVHGRPLAGVFNLEAADTVIDGFDAGDALGASIRVADITGEGQRDLIAGAPGGDGPSGSRPNGGEAYVVFGGGSFPRGRVNVGAVANVVFFGGSAGDNLGARLDSGDINRDVPDDIVFVSPGANSGAGDVRIYYGRPRSQFALGIDLATGYDRRLWASPADGPISAAMAYEMTGEGANDVVVGLSSATAGSAAGGGKVVVALSPKLSIASKELLIGARVARSKAITVANPGTGTVTWTASTSTPWLSVTGGSGASTSQGSGTFTLNVWPGSLPVGVHTGSITVRSTGFNLAYTNTYTVTLVVKTPEGDFDGDRKADVSLFRPSTGAWHLINSSTQHGQSLTWGGSGDLPVAGDYDGDGKMDIGVFRQSANTWYLRSSSTGALSSYVWGGAGDIPVPADYDGDARTDVAIFRPSTGMWYIRSSKDFTMSTYLWGGSGDKPVAADYDGDGRADVAVFRPSTGTWYVRESITQATVTYVWGGSGDLPVPGDYDADGRADIGVFRRSNGYWYIRPSTNPSGTSILWGGGNDVPVAGDYDADGLTDVAIFRPSTSAWYVRLATGAVLQYTWGGTGDVPILKAP
jgi:hypothetical protein